MSHPTVCSIHDDNSGLSVKWSVTHQHVIIMDRKIQPLKLTSNKQISRIQKKSGINSTLHMGAGNFRMNLVTLVPTMIKTQKIFQNVNSV